MSIAASGTYGKALTFSTWKGRAYVRERVIPANPRSPKQLGVRAMMKFLAQIWSGLGAVAKASWDERGAAASTSPFNAFCGYNLDRWQNIDAPSQAFPAAESSVALTVTTQTLTGGAGECSISVTPSGATNIWAIAIFRDDAEITTPSWANCIAVVPADGANAVVHIDSPLTAGTYHYRTAIMNVDGKMGTVKADATVVVT
jgi:hypothetical protein